MSNKQKVLTIMAHPDDEIICGWPIMQNQELERHLIIVCSDKYRKGPNRKRALEEVCQQEGIILQACLDINNNFYALPTRRERYLLTDAIAAIEKELKTAIIKIRPNYILTHNPCGFYGHGSHRLCFEIVSQHPEAKNVIFTDMCQESNHRSHSEIPWSVRDAYYHRNIRPEDGLHQKKVYGLDYEFFHRCKDIYCRRNAWTWDFPPTDVASLFIINED